MDNVLEEIPGSETYFFLSFWSIETVSAYGFFVDTALSIPVLADGDLIQLRSGTIVGSIRLLVRLFRVIYFCFGSIHYSVECSFLFLASWLWWIIHIWGRLMGCAVTNVAARQTCGLYRRRAPVVVLGNGGSRTSLAWIEVHARRQNFSLGTVPSGCTEGDNRPRSSYLLPFGIAAALPTLLYQSFFIHRVIEATHSVSKFIYVE